MAGRLRSCRGCRVLLLLMTISFVLTILAFANVWDPRPYAQRWWDTLTALSNPEPPWTARATGAPDVAAVMSSGQVVIASRGFVNGYRRGDGSPLWQLEVHWALPAGDVVVALQRPTNPDSDRAPDTGYSVIDPATGTVLWGERDAIAVWAYADAIVDLICPGSGDCQLRERTHRDGGKTEWSVPLPAGARTIRGPNPALPGTLDPAGWFAAAQAGTPPPLPQVLAFAVDGQLELVDTFEGVRVRQAPLPDRQTRVGLSGDRLLYVHAQRVDAGCRNRVEALDFRTGKQVWQRDGFDLGTASGAGCEQRRDPLGADRHLVVVNGENQPAVVSVDRADERWVGVPGERVLATRSGIVVVEGADRKTVRVIDVLSAARTVLWSGTLGLDPQAAITATHVILRDPDAGRLLVFSLLGMVKRLDIKTKATIIGYGSGGLIIASGRRFGVQPIG